jgi:hypothetical protein
LPLSGEAYYDALKQYETYRQKLAEYQKWQHRYEAVLERMILSGTLKKNKAHIDTLNSSEKRRFQEEATQSAKEKVKTPQSQDLIREKIETAHQLTKPAPVQKPRPTISTENLFKDWEDFAYESDSTKH